MSADDASPRSNKLGDILKSKTKQIMDQKKVIGLFKENSNEMPDASTIDLKN